MPNDRLDIDIVKQLMTLAGLAYGDPQNLGGYMGDGGSAPGWSLIWAAAAEPVPDVFAFIAFHKDTHNYAIAIRGTYPDPLSVAYWNDATLDSPYGPMQAWPGDPTGKAKIAKGTFSAFNDLLGQAGTGGQTFAGAAAALPLDATVYVTGHSLGGTLAPVAALWLSEQSRPLVTTVCAFAGMTPGNAAFAARFGAGTKLDGRVWRYNNTLDTVPYGWDRVWAAINFYGPGENGGLLVKGLIFLMGLILLFYGFRAIGTEIKLNGAVNPPVLKSALLSYVIENLRQHLPDTYITLLGAPALPFTIGFGAIVTDPGHAALPHMWTRRPRPFYF